MEILDCHLQIRGAFPKCLLQHLICRMLLCFFVVVVVVVAVVAVVAVVVAVAAAVPKIHDSQSTTFGSRSFNK